MLAVDDPPQHDWEPGGLDEEDVMSPRVGRYRITPGSLLFARLLLMMMIVGVVSCRTPALVPPEEGGHPWSELRSPRFVLYTNLSPAKGEVLIQEFERTSAALRQLAFRYPTEPREPTVIISFRSQKGYREVAPEGAAAFFRPSSDPKVPTIFLEGEVTDSARSVIQHEFTHRLLNFYVPGAPLWLHEGLAGYFETLDVKSGKAVLGRYPNHKWLFRPGSVWEADTSRLVRRIIVPTAAIPSPAELLTTSPADFHVRETTDPNDTRHEYQRVTANYAGAWALVHTLMQSPGYSERFNRFMTLLAQASASSSAWEEAFRGVDLESLGADVGTTLASREVITLQTDFSPPEVKIEATRTLSPSEVHLLWASVLPVEQARLEVGQALVLEPRSTEALLSKAHIRSADGDPEGALETVLEALETDSTNERCLLFLFELQLASASEREPGPTRWAEVDALAPALRAQASLAPSFAALARLALLRGAFDDAIDLAAEAVDRDFSCWRCMDTLASAIAGKGAFRHALDVQTIAVNITPEGYADDALLQRWELYKALAETTPEDEAAQE